MPWGGSACRSGGPASSAPPAPPEHVVSLITPSTGRDRPYLEPLQQAQPEEEEEEEQESRPAWDGVPEVRLLLDDGVEGDDTGEDEEESAVDKPRIVGTSCLGYGDHGEPEQCQLSTLQTTKLSEAKLILLKRLIWREEEEEGEEEV